MGFKPGSPYPTTADRACLGLGECGCPVLSALISSTGLHFACPSICAPFADPGQQYICRGCQATGLLVGVPYHWGDTAPLHTPTPAPTRAEGAGGEVGWEA